MRLARADGDPSGNPFDLIDRGTYRYAVVLFGGPVRDIRQLEWESGRLDSVAHD
jgi:hypothetical protein